METPTLLDKIIEAKEIIGDEAAIRIAEHYHVEQFDEKSLKGCCPFHHEKTPSFIWNKKDKTFKCFSCSKRASILDMYIETEGSYVKALQRLFKEAHIDYTLNALKPKQGRQLDNYNFPKEETNTKRDRVNKYAADRGISKETLDYAGVKEDAKGNCVFELRDIDGRLLAVKYRPSHSVTKDMPKMWWQPNADISPLLYNISKIDISKPLVITEGYFDTLAVIEAGYRNVVSIPGGAEDLNWIEFNYDFLQNIKEIILWFDNDKAGQAGLESTVQRLGEYRCKVVKPDEDDQENVRDFYTAYNADIKKTDANNILIACGKSRVISLIENSEEIPSKKLKYLMDCKVENVKDIEKISMGIKSLDEILYGNLFPCFTIYSGRTGCVDNLTEYFNGTEWKKISDYQDGEQILVYNQDGKAFLETPVMYHKYPDDGLYEFKTRRGVNQCLSKEHNVYYLDNNNVLQHKSFDEIMEIHNKFKYGFRGKFINGFSYSGSGIDLTDAEIKLMCAVICDGTFRNNANRCEFYFKKNRKKECLRRLFNECGIEYKEKQSVREGVSYFYANVPRREKEFTPYWYNCNNHQLKIICDNIMFWDGHESITDTGYMRRTFTTTLKSTADFIQFAYSACGYRASIITRDRRGKEYTVNGKSYIYKSIEYYIHVTNKKTSGMNNTYCKTKITRKTDTDGFKYCFTTSTGMWIMRRGNCITVTGNSGKSSIANITSLISPVEHGYKSFVFSGELAEGQLADWVVSPLAGYNHTQEIRSDNINERPYYVVTPQAERAIKDYYRKNMIIYSDEDGLDTSGEALLMGMEEAYKRYGCRVFIVDNLMCLTFDNTTEDSRWETQKKFIIRLMNFTEKYKANVNLILHPRKTSGYSKEPSTDDLHGASEIANLCHRLLWVDRLNPDENAYNTRITVVKDRPTQAAGRHCELYYDEKTRRIYSDLTEQRQVYSWEKHSNIKYSQDVDKILIKHKPSESLPHENSYYDPM